MNRDELINLMFDINAHEEERGDAAGYLTNFPDSASLEALSKVAKNKKESSYVRAKAGESIGLIMLAIGAIEERYIKEIEEDARDEMMAVFRDNQPSWYERVKKIIDN